MVIIKKSSSCPSSHEEIITQDVTVQVPIIDHEVKVRESEYSFELSHNTNINQLHKKVLSFIDKKLKNEYVDEVKPYLLTNHDIENTKAYLLIAKKYFNFNYTMRIKEDQKCIECGKKLKSDICSRCNTQNEWKSYSTIEDEQTPRKEKKKNFIKILMDFEGVKPLSNRMESQIRDIIGDNLTFDTVEEMMSILSQFKIKDLDKNMYNIFYFLKGRKHIEIKDETREAILERFEMFDEVQEEIKGDYERENSLNGQFILWCLLRSEGYNVSCSSFPILKTQNSLEAHNMMGRRIYMILSIRDNKFIWRYENFIN